MKRLVFSDEQFDLDSAVVGKIIHDSTNQIENHSLQVQSGPPPVSLQPVS